MSIPRSFRRTLQAAGAVLLAGALAPLASAQLFDLPRYLTAAQGGEIRDLGDFDADGDLDLLHFTGFLDCSDMTVFFNDGSGHFTPGPTYVFVVDSDVIVAQSQPAVGDFDGNGTLDVAVDHDEFTSSGAGLEVLFGDGAGGFSSHFLPMGRGPRNFFAGQTDGDATDELFVYKINADYTREFVWLDWRGDHFRASAALPIGGASDPLGAFVLAAGDFDSDGDTDVAATSVDYTTVRLFPTVQGSPSVGQQWSVIPSMGNVNHRLAAGDLDGDGDDDLLHVKSLVTQDPGPWMRVFENTGTGLVAHAPFQVAALAEGALQPHNIHLADWNGDGWLDVFSNSYDCKRLRSDGAWGWVDGFELRGTGGSHPGGGAGDVTGDGLLDYVATQAFVAGDGVFPDGPEAEIPGGFAISAYGDHGHVLDQDGDGDLDIVASTNPRWNDGTGQFTTAVAPFVGLPFADSVSPAALADFDGDGRRDLVVGLYHIVGVYPNVTLEFDSMRLLVDDGIGHYVHAGLAFPAGIELPNPVLDSGYWDTGDADGDGDTDILVTNGYWRNDGSGHFAMFIGLWSGRGRGAFDVRGDGDIDFLVTRDLIIETEIVLYERNSLGSLTIHSLAIQDDNEAEPELADLDGDGDLDVWSGHPDLDGVLVWENTPAGLVQAPTLDARGVRLHEPAFEDIDGDGVDELLLSRDTGSIGLVASAQRRVGPGLTFEIAEEYLAFWEIESFIDGDGDGDRDIFGHHRSENVRVQQPAGGVVQQFGSGFAGSGAVVPILGAAGPITSDNAAAELRLVRGVGAGPTYVFLGLSATTLPGFPAPGMALYVDDPILFGPAFLTGPAGAVGAGTLAVELPHDTGLVGITLVLQAFIFDAGSPTGLSQTQALSLTFGL